MPEVLADARDGKQGGLSSSAPRGSIVDLRVSEGWRLQLAASQKPHLVLQVLVDGERGDGRRLHADVPQLEAHEVARQHVPPAPAELQVRHGRQQLGEEAALCIRLLRLHVYERACELQQVRARLSAFCLGFSRG